MYECSNLVKSLLPERKMLHFCRIGELWFLSLKCCTFAGLRSCGAPTWNPKLLPLGRYHHRVHVHDRSGILRCSWPTGHWPWDGAASGAWTYPPPSGDGTMPASSYSRRSGDDSDELKGNGNSLLGDPIDLQKTFRYGIGVEGLQHSVNKQIKI